MKNNFYLIRNIFTLILSLCFFSFFAQDFSLTHNFPASANPNQTFETEFLVKKGNIGSFAKFQCDLPIGFTAVAIDIKGGNFTYENQRVKIVWVSVPSESNFTFKIKFTPPLNALNECVVSPKFYYLENNIKKEFESSPHHIKIIGKKDEAKNSSDLNLSVANAEKEKEKKDTESSTPTTPTNASNSTNSKLDSQTNAKEQKQIEGEKVIVQDKTEKPLEQSNTDNTSKNVTKPDETKTKVSSNTKIEENKEINTSINSSEKTSSLSRSNTNSTDQKIYKIQLGAFSTSPSKSKFPGINFSVQEEGGLYKVLVGSFSSKEEAEKQKAEFVSKGMQCIVVAYQNGLRVKP